ncbi:MAG: efflux RND transporter permease subunit [Acidocella sp.]|uniref:efflux RND transporter permease subunit n=1 Tax=Acidocella sp. TaxID=50710 RepID=UPI003FD7577C
MIRFAKKFQIGACAPAIGCRRSGRWPSSSASRATYLGFGGLTLNIYTEVGLVTLMGLVSKHGILMTEVANEARLRGMKKRAAIEYAANIRLRPILMTTAAMVLGVVPLIFAGGAGAASRYAMGMVIAGGLSIGTMFTLFVVPAVYMVLSSKKDAEHEPVS